MAKLYFKYGAMGSSKTANALITKFNYEERGMKVWLLKPATDDRDGKDIIKSRIGLACRCFVVTPETNIVHEYEKLPEYDAVIVDEAQFLTPEQIDELRYIVDNKGIPVLCFGLRTDFLTHVFPGSLRLLEIADSISEIKTICRCGSKATVNARIDENGNVITDGEQVLIGGNDSYEAMCYSCYMKKIKNNKEKRISMDIKEILAKVDHTVLGQTATWEEIKGLCDDGMKYETASVCIPPSYVKQAAEYIKSVNGHLKVCTVIGFPNGYNTTAVKCFEAETAVNEGAEEIDMVINIGWVKDGLYDKVLDEIRQIKAACHGKLLKVIIETCLLTDEEKIKLCKVVSESGAEYIKTSTGFSKAGATFADVELMVKNVDGILVKAAGGISSIADAEKFIELGASRLGTSRIVKLVKAESADNQTY